MCKHKNKCVKRKCNFSHDEKQIVKKKIVNPYNSNQEYKEIECHLKNCKNKICPNFHTFDETRLGILLNNLNQTTNQNKKKENWVRNGKILNISKAIVRFSVLPENQIEKIG